MTESIPRITVYCQAKTARQVKAGGGVHPNSSAIGCRNKAKGVNPEGHWACLRHWAGSPNGWNIG